MAGKYDDGLREKILTTAERILRQSGLKRLAQPQVAKEANIRQSHLTYYFPKRSDLILAVTEKTLGSLSHLVQTYLPNRSSQRSLLDSAIYPFVIKLLEDKDRTRALIGLLVESDENPELRSKLRELSGQEKTLLARFLGVAEANPAVEVAHAALFGLAIKHYLNETSPRGSLKTQVKTLHTWAKAKTKERNKKL